MILRQVRRLLRLVLVVLHVLVGLLVALVLLRPGTGGMIPTRPMVIWSRVLARILGLRITVGGLPCEGVVLLVANHISWLDIFCISAVCPTHFLAKQEVASWPVLGWLCRRAGTAFIRRGSGDGASEAMVTLVWRLRQGERMLIFPEGTSSTGADVKRFHPRLFQAAIHSRCPVQVIALRYPGEGGLNGVVPFIGDDRFVVHLWRLLAENDIVAELYFGDPLLTEGQSRDALAKQAQRQVSELLRLAGSDGRQGADNRTALLK